MDSFRKEAAEGSDRADGSRPTRIDMLFEKGSEGDQCRTQLDEALQEEYNNWMSSLADIDMEFRATNLPYEPHPEGHSQIWTLYPYDGPSSADQGQDATSLGERKAPSRPTPTITLTLNNLKELDDST